MEWIIALIDIGMAVPGLAGSAIVNDSSLF